ncbi:MAG: flagellar motor switch protein FliG [Treponema sp.]|jgi:flagellar motor switch protein FliG|nr:flagellar motor switch protein FliG [Treponema sp.]
MGKKPPYGIGAYHQVLLYKNKPQDTKPEALIKQVKPAPAQDSKYRRVAKFLILIGGGEAARILSELESDQVEAVSREIASIPGITAEEGEAVLEEFRSLLSAPYGYSGSSFGGIAAGRRLLYAAFGPEKGEALLNKAVPESRENLFDFLEDFSADQLVLILKDESPAAEALILSRLSSKRSASVLAKTSGERKLDIVRRIAHQAEVSPEVLEQVAVALKEKVRHIGRPDSETLEIDGMNTLAAILKHGDYSFGDRIINELEDSSPDLGRDLKERLYTLDDIIAAEDRPLQEKLRAMNNRDIALLLKGRSLKLAEKILSNVSAQRRALIKEEGEILGTVLKRESDEAAGNFLAWFRSQREEGHILLMSDEDVIV